MGASQVLVGHGGSDPSRSTHLGQRGRIGGGACGFAFFAQQQFAESAPHGVTQPQAFTVYRV